MANSDKSTAGKPKTNAKPATTKQMSGQSAAADNAASSKLGKDAAKSAAKTLSTAKSTAPPAAGSVSVPKTSEAPVATKRASPKTGSASAKTPVRPGGKKLDAAGKAAVQPDAKALYEMIAEAAYYRAEKRNFAPGHEIEDWEAAREEVMARLGPSDERSDN